MGTYADVPHVERALLGPDGGATLDRGFCVRATRRARHASSTARGWGRDLGPHGGMIGGRPGRALSDLPLPRRRPRRPREPRSGTSAGYRRRPVGPSAGAARSTAECRPRRCTCDCAAKPAKSLALHRGTPLAKDARAGGLHAQRRPARTAHTRLVSRLSRSLGQKALRRLPRRRLGQARARDRHTTTRAGKRTPTTRSAGPTGTGSCRNRCGPGSAYITSSVS